MENQDENERWREICAVMMREEKRKIIADASFLKIKRERETNNLLAASPDQCKQSLQGICGQTHANKLFIYCMFCLGSSAVYI